MCKDVMCNADNGGIVRADCTCHCSLGRYSGPSCETKNCPYRQLSSCPGKGIQCATNETVRLLCPTTCGPCKFSERPSCADDTECQKSTYGCEYRGKLMSPEMCRTLGNRGRDISEKCFVSNSTFENCKRCGTSLDFTTNNNLVNCPVMCGICAEQPDEKLGNISTTTVTPDTTTMNTTKYNSTMSMSRVTTANISTSSVNTTLTPDKTAINTTTYNNTTPSVIAVTNSTPLINTTGDPDITSVYTTKYNSTTSTLNVTTANNASTTPTRPTIKSTEMSESSTVTRDIPTVFTNNTTSNNTTNTTGPHKTIILTIEDRDPQDTSSNGGLIGGLVVASLGIIALVCLLVFCIVRRHKKKEAMKTNPIDVTSDILFMNANYDEVVDKAPPLNNSLPSNKNTANEDNYNVVYDFVAKKHNSNNDPDKVPLYEDVPDERVKVNEGYSFAINDAKNTLNSDLKNVNINLNMKDETYNTLWKTNSADGGNIYNHTASNGDVIYDRSTSVTDRPKQKEDTYEATYQDRGSVENNVESKPIQPNADEYDLPDRSDDNANQREPTYESTYDNPGEIEQNMNEDQYDCPDRENDQSKLKSPIYEETYQGQEKLENLKNNASAESDETYYDQPFHGNVQSKPKVSNYESTYVDQGSAKSMRGKAGEREGGSQGVNDGHGEEYGTLSKVEDIYNHTGRNDREEPTGDYGTLSKSPGPQIDESNYDKVYR